MYVFQLFDFYGASGISLLYYCFWQSIVIGWIYSKFNDKEVYHRSLIITYFLAADRFYDNIEEMIHLRISPWFRWCWRYLTPALTLSTLTFYVVTHRPLKYNDVEYPGWGLAIGYGLALSSIIMLPASMAYIWFSTPAMPNVNPII